MVRVWATSSLLFLRTDLRNFVGAERETANREVARFVRRGAGFEAGLLIGDGDGGACDHRAAGVGDTPDNRAAILTPTQQRRGCQQ